ncbi:MAG: methylmalonyl-CoA epimerase [Rickettsiales bacterium]|nr:methylmalonyl-CoA epimerase [Rickettsiales bacterium]|tara:strand:- start:598 stop:1002 length:405 start_codon:yes stop_codon:yes gene_type:complete
MITKFNHVAIAVKDLAKARNLYKEILGGNVSDISNYKNHGVSVCFVDLGNTKIELMQPFGTDSPIEKFLLKNNFGGIHHICLEVDNILKTRDHLLKNNISIIGNKEPKIGAHNKPVLFLHPKDLFGTLIELEQE